MTSDDAVAQLCAFGFDEDRARKMLEYTHGDVDKAANHLMDNFTPPEVSAPAPSPTGELPVYGPQPNNQLVIRAKGWEDPERHTKVDASAPDYRPSVAPYDPAAWGQETDRGRSRVRESAPPPEAGKGDKNDPIDVDSMPMLIEDKDSDLARAIKMSLDDNPGADVDMQRATAASLADQQSVTSWDSEPPEKRIRLDMSTPVNLRASSPLLTALPPILQALYACEPVREGILALTLGHVPHQIDRSYTLDGYWRGQTVWSTEGAESDPRALMMALQRLFVVMERTRRSTVQVSDLEAILRPNARGSSNSPIEAGRLYLTAITDAFTKCACDELEHEQADNLIDVDGERVITGLSVLRSIVSKVSNHDHSSYLGFVAMAAHGFGNDPPSLHASLDAHLTEDSVIDEPADAGIFLIMPRAPAPGQPRRSLKLEQQIWLDRYTNAKHVRSARSKARELFLELREVEAGLQQLGDPVEALEAFDAVVEYYKEHAEVKDAANTSRGDQVAAALAGVEQAQKAYLEQRDKLTTRIETVQKERSTIFDADELKQLGPYELAAVTVWAGKPGRDFIFTYVRTGDQWHRVGSDLNMPVVTSVSWEAVESEQAGVHLSGGSYGLFYSKARRQPLSRASLVAIEAAVDDDNRSFAAELPNALTSDWNLSQEQPMDMPMTPDSLDRTSSEPLVPTEVSLEPMAIDSPPVKEMIDLDESNRLRGGSISGQANEADESDSDESDEENEESPEVDLGLVKPIRKPLQVASMNGKVGGRPMWLNPDAPLQASELICGICDGRIGATGAGVDEPLPMRFLLQVNAPDPDQPDAYRAIYLFACHRGACVLADPTKSVKILRCQLPEDNAYYAYDSLKDRVEVLKPASDGHLCQVCGLAGELRCDKCSAVSYCSRRCLESARASHQLLCGQTDVADPQRQSSQSRLKNARDKIVWREGALDVEPEPERLQEDDSSVAMQGLTVQPSEPNSSDDKAPDTKPAVDKTFMRFHERVQREPKQVLRYYRHAEIPDEPLWVSANGKPDSVPPCSLCSAERTCEMQILSTLITHLGVDDTVEGSFDFGTLLVYTCSASCDLPSEQPWATEVCYGQQFSSDGVDLGMRRPVS